MTNSIPSLILVLSLLLLSHADAAQPKRCSYNALYQFGDSISDTGNLFLESQGGTSPACHHIPYGQTYFGKPTGRCSDGLLMIDFLAKTLDLPLLYPYLSQETSTKPGSDFAVSGATALETDFLLQRNIQQRVTNSSLLVQLNWFFNHLDSMCFNAAECANKIKKALFMVGEIGGNDYNNALLQNKTMDEAKSLVPHVVNNIRYTAKKLIKLGATRVVIPGHFPIGCLPFYLTIFRSNSSASYDENKCLKSYNELARYHNKYIQRAIKQLKAEFPDVVLMYADYYNALMWILNHASRLGFEKGAVKKACCGTGGEYNFNLARFCGSEGASACPNPDRYITWDGIHLTQKANQYMVQWLVRHLSLKSQCVH